MARLNAFRRLRHPGGFLGFVRFAFSSTMSLGFRSDIGRTS